MSQDARLTKKQRRLASRFRGMYGPTLYKRGEARTALGTLASTIGITGLTETDYTKVISVLYNKDQ